MNNSPDPHKQAYLADEINFIEVFKVIWKRKKFLIYFTSIISLVTLIYALSLPNIYESEAILSPVTDQGGVSQSLKNYQGLASLAGIDLSGPSDNSNLAKALEKIDSFSFFSKNILPNIYLPDLMALRSWDPSTNTLEYNSKYFDEISQKWIFDGKDNFPTAQDSFEIFKKHLTVSEKKENNFISISIRHKSPFIAKDWTELIVNEINKYFRSKDKLEAQKAVNYLNLQISQTNFVEVKQAIAEILQQKTQQLTLIEVNESYVFEYIDPPVVMEKNKEPNRLLIFFFGTLLGILLGMSFILFRYFIYPKNID